MASYRIEFSIQRAEDDGGDFAEIGFGTSFSHATIDAALHDVDSLVQNDMWETMDDMPEPEKARADEAAR